MLELSQSLVSWSQQLLTRGCQAPLRALLSTALRSAVVDDSLAKSMLEGFAQAPQVILYLFQDGVSLLASTA